ncbi:sulfatase family protein [Hyunsoonleella aestuarii]|uniref:Sulfatase n=1 Tax=Hyunsoonleella aestuarii TaxID=912802 RepID=A0ABP8EEL7_9FLAO|nr:sulfatase [Hyunsoonleella aestuarii]
MIRNIFLLIALFSLVSCKSVNGQNKGNTTNILLITLDDMNWDSAGIYGNTIPDLTPNIDRLGNEGLVFENGYVQVSNCSPSRSVIQTSLYPHQSGMRGFYYVQPEHKTLPEILKEQGFYTGVINKAPDSSLSPDFDLFWNTTLGFKGIEKRSAEAYSKLVTKFFSNVKNSNKPFYCVVNVADPHKPFFNDMASRKKGFDKFKPSKIYTKDDVEIPGFLPKNPRIKQEMVNYYNSVKRGDDCVGAILKTLDSSSFSGNTIVILLSDHGMPLPYAKSTTYQNGLRVPFIVRWPNSINPNTRNTKDLVSAIDIAPTILDMLNIDIPSHFEGTSFNPKTVNKSNKYVFGQFDENAGGIPRPSRTVITKKYGYVFNPWATGKYEFKSASGSHTSYKAMKKLAETDPEVKKRFDHWVYREIEELYDYENDPNALTNLIHDPKYKEIVAELRTALEKHMKATGDYVLAAYGKKDNTQFLNNWMKNQIKEANHRNETIKWKRPSNHSGPTKGNTELFQIK